MKITEEIHRIYRPSLRAAAATVIESLEIRRLLTTSFATLSHTGTLMVTGDASGNDIHVDLVGSNVVAHLDQQSASFDTSTVKRFYVDGSDGDDKIAVNLKKPATLIGNGGSDTLIGSAANDLMEGNGDADTMTASGANTFVMSSGQDTIIGGGGPLVVDYSAQNSIKLDLEGYTEDVSMTSQLGETDLHFIYDQPMTILGTAGNDTITGQLRHNAVIHAGPGKDSIKLFGFEGDSTGDIPTVHGDGGNDIIDEEGSGFEVMAYGEAGNDTFNLHDADWSVVAQGGSGTDAEDFMFTNPLASQQLSPGIENGKIDTPEGLTGTNQLTGNDLDNLIIGSPDTDQIDGGGGNDTIDGGDSRDRLIGGPGHDVLNGEGGNDLLYGIDSTQDTLNGGDGIDFGKWDNSDTIVDVRISIEGRL